jgi:hypothetical protein
MTIVFNQVALMNGKDDGGGDVNLNIRVVVKAALLSAGVGNQCQLEFRAGNLTTTPTVAPLTSMFFGQQGTTEPDFNGNQKQVFFSGAASPATGAWTANAIITSDIFTLGENFDSTKNYVCAYHYSASIATSVSQASATLTNSDAWFAAGSDTASANHDGTLTNQTSVLQLLEKITITALPSGGNLPMMGVG